MGRVLPKAVPAAGMILILGIFPFFESLLAFFRHCFTAAISTGCSEVHLSSSMKLCALLSW